MLSVADSVTVAGDLNQPPSPGVPEAAIVERGDDVSIRTVVVVVATFPFLSVARAVICVVPSAETGKAAE